ncbi:RICIN domain-containing protein [Prevotella communis]|uniref:LamG-like jellyroll fold domain-containing protein n=1 Tax=Prevotella communis TaxID=2913614 RepID=UPI001EDAA2A3|nr:LamG-like jellyroll fold domain-containing protein [Prevotella communis]UKK63150.1 RICIN domain-containing protein [Prevotella communis]UKK65975.1 RICIN domain-containing protein [Prevotella communis]
MMNKKRNILFVVAALGAATAFAQEPVRSSSSLYLHAQKKADVSLPYAISAEGKRFQPTWGLDLAWNNESNLRKGVNHMGKENVGIGRTSFRVLNALKDGNQLTSDQIEGLRSRSNVFDNVVGRTLPLVINCDNGYMPNGHTGPYINTYYTAEDKSVDVEHWAKCIEAHVLWMKTNTSHPIVGVSPFNEPDNAWEKNLAGEIQGNAGDEANVAKLLKSYDSMNGIVIAGANTLNNDNAWNWFNAGKQYYDWGNTHQLAGSFANFANFYQQLKNAEKVGFDDEMHNVVEAMVGLEYGMTVGIWWGFDSRARGEFCDISRNGVRLAYGEHRNNWTAASVYRHDDGRVKAFVGSSERQAKTTTYQFVSTERDVYYDGYGPVHEFVMEMPGGTGYQTGQTNGERVINVTWGEDVPPSEINGTYKLLNKVSGATGNVVSYTSSGDVIKQSRYTGSKKQQWTVKPCSSRIGGDYSFYNIESVDNANIRMNVKDYSKSQADILAWTQNGPTSNEQWYLEYDGNGYYLIRNRESALYLASAGTSTMAKIIQTPELTGTNRDRMLFRFVPVDVTYDTAAPAKPAGLLAESQSASVRLSWTANTETDVEGYMVVRAPKGTDDWNTIARQLTETYFVDNTCRPNTSYIYKVKAIDRSQNISEASDVVEAAPLSQPTMIARWDFEDNLNDDTQNMLDMASPSTPKYVADHKVGDKSLSLTAQFVQLPYRVADSDELSVAMWVKWNTSTTQWQRIFDFGNDEDHYLFLTPNSGTSKMRFAIKNGGDEQILDCPSKLSSYLWKHVVVTMGKDKTAIYVDGTEVASTTGITIKPSDIRPVLNYLGRSQYTADPNISANYDDVRIFNYALSADEVKAVKDGTYTNIQSVENSDAVSKPIYTIDGKRIDRPQQGINIIDSRKILMK